jgi:hypothetical protein
MLIPNAQVNGRLTQSYLGYTTAGASSTTPGANTFGWYLKQIVVPSAGMIVSVDAYVHGNGSNVVSFGAGLWLDNAGVPGNLFAVSATSGLTTGTVVVNDIEMYLSSTPRWMSKPMATWVASGTYWIGVVMGNNGSIHYDSGGSDCTGNANSWAADASLTTYSAGSNRYSIRASVVS